LAQWIHEHPEQEAVADENEDIQEGVREEEEEEQYDVWAFHGTEEEC
jgi:hypothetical protein